MSVMKLIHRPLSDEDLRKLLGSDLRILKYSELAEVRDLNELLTRPQDYCIILYEEVLDTGHWTGLLKYNGVFEHFDSYGVRPDAELHWINLKNRQKLGEVTPYLSNLLRSQHYLHNTVKFQSDEHGVNTCGSHVAHRLYRLRNQNMDLRSYQDFMKGMKKETQQSYDYIVSAWVRSELG